MSVHSAPGGRLAAEVEIALYRIAQQALDNIAKYARATRAMIVLGCSGPDHVLWIADNGTGFSHMDGMAAMRERARAAGGELQVDLAPRQGTRLTVRVPTGGG